MEALRVEQVHRHRDVRLRWDFANTVGFSLAYLVAALIGNGLGSFPARLLGFALGGALAGLLQWHVLRPHLPRMGWCILGGSAGFLIGNVGGYIVGAASGYPRGVGVAHFFGGIAMVGVINGMLQARALRRQGAPRPGRWIAASSLGFAAGGAAGAVLIALGFRGTLEMLLGPVSLTVLEAVLGMVAGAVGGAVTGPVLRSLVRPLADAA